MNKLTPNISIIVPVYNAIHYLERCINSILKQSYNNFELILVDDGSTDGSGIICDKYSLLDKRVKSVHKTNGGVSTARNIGLKESDGEFVTFVDADDWIDEDYLLFLFDTEYDIVISGYKEHKTNSVLEIKYNNNKCIDIRDFPVFFSENDVLSVSFNPWRKLFRAEIIKKNNLRFDENTSLGEDTIFVFNYLQFINNIKIIQNTGYNYSFGIGLCHKYFPKAMYIYSLNRTHSALDSILKEKLISEEYNEKMKSYFNIYYGSQILRANYNLNYNYSERKATVDYLKKNFKPWNSIVGMIFIVKRFSGYLADLFCLLLNKIERLK